MEGMIATKKMIDNIIDGTTPPQQATKSTQDGDGNIIKSTYATKNELTSGLSGKANTSGSYPNLTVGKATNADKATNATNATNAASATRADNDGNGDSIVDTYAKKDGTYMNMRVGYSDKAESDWNGNSIINTYALKTGVSNENIIINPDFQINQRNLTSTLFIGYLYTFDRWYTGTSVEFTKSEQYVQIRCTSSLSDTKVMQYIEKGNMCLGKTFTFSTITDDEYQTFTFTLPSDYPSTSTKYGEIGKWSFWYNTEKNAYEIRLTIPKNITVKVSYVKLEAGEEATQFMRPDYATELAKCQRYFIRIKQGNKWGVYSNCGWAQSTINARAFISLPVTMRISPTLRAYGKFSFTRNDDNAMYDTEVSNFTTHSSTETGVTISADASSDAFKKGQTGHFQAFNDANTHLDFDAEI